MTQHNLVHCKPSEGQQLVTYLVSSILGTAVGAGISAAGCKEKNGECSLSPLAVALCPVFSGGAMVAILPIIASYTWFWMDSECELSLTAPINADLNFE